MTDEERAFLEREINRQYKWYNRGSKLWSAVHHWSLTVSALLSALATLVLKSEWIRTLALTYRDDIAAGLAAAATLVTSIAASGGFGGKWQANRRSRGRIDQIRIDFSSPHADAKSIREDLEDIIKEHDDFVTRSSAQLRR